MNTLSDHPQRQRALDPTASFIVQAPAGSGKTGLLVRRLLTLLALAQKPEEILAITFTRKATQEMRERVIGSLVKASNNEEFEEHEKDLSTLAQTALGQDKQLGWNLIENANRLRIMTIDSLCADLVRRMPWSARFGAMPQIEQSPGLLYQQAALNCITQLEHQDNSSSDAIATLLINLEGNLPTLQARLAHMLYNRDRWLPLILGKSNQAALLEKILEAWQSLVKNELIAIDNQLSPSTQEALLNIAAYCAANLPQQHQNSAFGKVMLSYADEGLNGKVSDITKWQVIHSLLITGTALRKPRGINARMGLGADVKSKEKQQLINIIGELEGNEEVIKQLAQIALLPKAEFDSTQKNLFIAITTVLPTLASELYLLMSERGIADYPQITTQAIDALGNLQQPSDLALILDAKLNHILMDEFQDTSPHQLRLLERLCAGWQSDDGRSLFLVGDPMQSIYRFRDADVRVFLDVRDHGINDIHPEDLRLNTNFRSAAPMVQWVNKTLPDVLSEQDQPEWGAVKFSPSMAFKQKDAGEVHCQMVISSNANDEGKIVAKQVQDLAQQVVSEHQIAVLARTRNHLKSVARGLRQAGTQFEAIEIELLGDQSCIQDLMAITRLFLHPLDIVAWLSILRAPWCGLTLHDITILRANNRSKISLWDNDEVIDNLSADGATRYQRLANIMQPRITHYHGDLTNRIRNTWLALSGPACVLEHELAYCDAYFNLLRELDKQNQSITAKTLDKAVSQTRVSSPAAQIKLLTLHKAKGLEFDTVFLVGLSGKQKTNEQIPKLLEWDASSHTQPTLIAPANAPGGKDTKHTDWIKTRDKQRENLEAGRLLYVGVTRAKSALYLFGHLKKETAKPESSSLLHLLWDQLGAEFQKNSIQVTPNNAQNEDGLPPQTFIRRLKLNLPPLALPAPLRVTFHQSNNSSELEYEWAQDQARIVGIVVHKVMQIRGRDNLVDWNLLTLKPYVERQLTQLGLASQDNVEAASLVMQYLENTQQDKKAHWIFNVLHQEIKIEWALSGLIRGQIQHRIIDRSFIDETGTRWVIDFKTSPHKGPDVEHFLDEQQKRYTEQLNDYGLLVHGLEPNTSIKLGLYFPALKAWREWAYNI